MKKPRAKIAAVERFCATGSLAGKERLGEIEREGGIGVEIVPLDEVAERADEDRLEAARDVGGGFGLGGSGWDHGIAPH